MNITYQDYLRAKELLPKVVTGDISTTHYRWLFEVFFPNTTAEQLGEWDEQAKLDGDA